MGDFSFLFDDLEKVTGQKVSRPKTPEPEPEQPAGDRRGYDVASVVDDELTKLGYGENQRLSILGDIGRENGWNRDVIFKGHSDPKNNVFNRGVISWQGDRRTSLDNYLRTKGVLGKNDDNELRGMVRFMDEEMRTQFPGAYKKLRSAKSTYDASEALREYIKYVPDAPYNTFDPEFRVKNNRTWAEKARRLGLGAKSGGDLSFLMDDANKIAAPQSPQTGGLDFLSEDFKKIVGNAPQTPQAPLTPQNDQNAMLDRYSKSGSNLPFAEWQKTQVATSPVQPQVVDTPAQTNTETPRTPRVTAVTAEEQADIDTITKPGQFQLGQTQFGAIPATDEQQALLGRYKDYQAAMGITAPTDQTWQDFIAIEQGQANRAAQLNAAAQPRSVRTQSQRVRTNRPVPASETQTAPQSPGSRSFSFEIETDAATKADRRAFIEQQVDSAVLRRLEGVTQADIDSARRAMPATFDFDPDKRRVKVNVNDSFLDLVEKIRNARGRMQGGSDPLDAMFQEGLIDDETLVTRKYEAEQERLKEEERRQEYLKENGYGTMGVLDRLPFFLTGWGGQALRGETPEETEARWLQEKNRQLEIDSEAIRQAYGSFDRYFKDRERIRNSEIYGFRPMAAPTEFALNIGRYFMNIPATILKASAALNDLNPLLNWFDLQKKPTDAPAWKLAKEWEDRVNASQNQDFRDANAIGQFGSFMVNDVSKALGQFGAQALLAPFTGGASVALPLLEAMVGQYEEAEKGGAGKGGRILATILGGVLAIPDAILKLRMMKSLTPGAKLGFLDNLGATLFGNLSKVMAEGRAREVTATAINAFIAQSAKKGFYWAASGAGRGAAGGGAEAFQEYTEDVGNGLAAKYIYKPDITWRDIFVPDERRVKGYLAAGIVGAFGGNIELVAEKLSSAELARADEVLFEEIKAGRLKEEQAAPLARAIRMQFVKRNMQIDPNGVVNTLAEKDLPDALDKTLAKNAETTAKRAELITKTVPSVLVDGETIANQLPQPAQTDNTLRQDAESLVEQMGGAIPAFNAVAAEVQAMEQENNPANAAALTEARGVRDILGQMVDQGRTVPETDVRPDPKQAATPEAPVAETPQTTPINTTPEPAAEIDPDTIADPSSDPARQRRRARQALVRRAAKPEPAANVPPQAAVQEKPTSSPVAVANTDRREVVTERGTRATIAPQVIDSNDLITSLEPGYPSELQPRDRGRVASKAQIAEIANKLNPARLDDSPMASDGRPLVVPVEVDGRTRYAVVSGNGRVEAIRTAYDLDNEPSRGYAEFARSKGDSTAARPVYVGVLDPAEVGNLTEFAKEANESAVAQMSATEQAKSDAERLDGNLMSLFVPAEDGSIHGAANRDFIRGFMDRIAGTNDRSRLVNADGSLNQEGVLRVRNAIFAKAFGDSPAGLAALQRMSESTDNNVRNITAALLSRAPQLAELKELVARGDRFPEFDITPDLARAMEKYAALKETGASVDEYIQQGNLFGAETTPFQTRIIQVFDAHKRGVKAVRSILDNFLSAAEAFGNPNQQNLFGAPEKVNVESVFEGATRAYEKDIIADPTTVGLFEENQRGEVETGRGPKGDELAAEEDAEVNETATAADAERANETPNLKPLETPSSRVEKIEDFGEKIGGARKDLAKALTQITGNDLTSLPLSKSFPRPDFNTLIKDGSLSRDAAVVVDYLYQWLPAKPRKNYKMQRWVSQVEAVVDVLQYSLENPNASMDTVVDRAMGTALRNDSLPQSTALHAKILERMNWPEKPANLGGYIILEQTERWFQRGADPSIKALIVKNGYILGEYRSIDDAVDALARKLQSNKAKAASSVKFGIYQDRQTKDFFVGKKGVTGVVRMAEGFSSAKDARTHLENHQTELETKWTALKETPNERRDNLRPRVGPDWRKGENITPETLANTFGFRGIEFGNWVNNAERQDAINDAFDALMDMSTALKISPAAVSLNGELGIAFGARGGGRFKVHYEPGKVVINITKNRGGGSLSHEWWHAVDNYFSRLGGNRYGYVTDMNSPTASLTGVRPEMLSAFRDVIKAIDASQLRTRSRMLDRTRSKPYWSTPVEMSARSFENFIIEKLGQANEHNDYLASFKDIAEWVRGSSFAADSYPYPLRDESETINAAYQSFFDTIQERQTERGIGLFKIADSSSPESLRRQKSLNAVDNVLDLLPDVESRVQGDTVKLSLEAGELFRTASAVISGADIETEPNISGQFLNPSEVKSYIATLKEFAAIAREDGRDDGPINDLVKHIQTAAKENGTVLINVFDDSVAHERGHQTGFLAASPSARALMNRVGGVDGQGNVDAFLDTKDQSGAQPLKAIVRVAFEKFFKKHGYDVSTVQGRAVVVEEVFNYVQTGDGARLGLSAEQEATFLYHYMKAFVGKHGEQALDKFDWFYQQFELADNHLKQVRDEIEQAKTQEGTRPGNSPDGTVGVETSREGSDQGTDQKDRGPAETGQESDRRLPGGGKLKESNTPKTLRANGINLDDRLYASATNAGQQEFADQQLDKGADQARKWFEDQAADNNYNAGATTAVALSLMNHFGKTGDVKALNEVADKLVPMLTEAGQAIQAMALVSLYNPDTAGAYAAKVKKQKTGKDITQEELEKAKTLAKELSEVAKAEGITKALLEKAEAAVKDLQKENESLKATAENLRTDKARISIKLSDAANEIRNLKRRLLGVKTPKPQAPRTSVAKLKETLEKQKGDLERVLADAFKDGGLKMVAWHGSPHLFDKFSLDKIGTGEGAQAYGWGLYFAGAEEVADYYRRQLTADRDPTVTENRKSQLEDWVGDRLTDAQARRLNALLEERNWNENAEDDQLDLNDQIFYQALDEALNVSDGAKYQVDLKPTEDQYLLWDKPLSEQSETVKKALLADGFQLVTDADLESRVGDDLDLELPYFDYEVKPADDGTFEVYINGEYDTWFDTEQEAEEYGQTESERLTAQAEKDARIDAVNNANLKDFLLPNEIRADEWTGEDFYQRTLGGGKRDSTNTAYDQADASLRLLEAGIRGIKYLDGTSRSKGEGNYNYVIFDDADVEITEILRQIAPDVLTEEQEDALVKLTALDIINGRTFDETIDGIRRRTRETLTDEQIRTIHAMADAKMRGKRELTDDQKAAIKIRNEHHRKAQAHLDRFEREAEVILSEYTKKLKKEDKATKPLDKSLDFILRTGIDGDYSDAAIVAALGRGKSPDALIKDMRANFPDMTATEIRQALKDADEIHKAAVESVRRYRVMVREQNKIGETAIERILEERRVNAIEKQKASRQATAFYDTLSKTMFQSVTDSVVAFTKANLLSAVKTHMKNILGNLVFGASLEGQRAIGSLADIAISYRTHERAMQGVSPTGMKDGFMSLFRQDQAMKKLDQVSGITAAKNIMWYGDSVDNMSKLQLTESNLKAHLGKAGSIADAYINFVFRALSAEDALFKVYAFRRSLEEQASVMAKNEGGTKAEQSARRKELLENPTNVMQEFAREFADFSTFQNDNKLSSVISQTKAKVPTVVRAGFELLVPFDRTPTNIVLRVLDHTPVGLVKAGIAAYKLETRPDKAVRDVNTRFRAAVARDLDSEAFRALSPDEQRAKIEQGLARVFNQKYQREFSQLMGAGAGGTFGLVAIGFSLASLGLLAGAMSADSDDREEKNEAFERMKKGIDSGSVRIPGVGRFRLPDAPASKAMLFGATMYEQAEMARKQKKDALGAAIDGVSEATKDAVFEQPLLRSTKDLLSSRQTAGGFTGNLASRFIPASAMIRSISEVTDDEARRKAGYTAKESEGKSTFDIQSTAFQRQFLGGVPGLRTFNPISAATVPKTERGGWVRRLVRELEPFNVRSDTGPTNK